MIPMQRCILCYSVAHQKSWVRGSIQQSSQFAHFFDSVYPLWNFEAVRRIEIEVVVVRMQDSSCKDLLRSSDGMNS